jgi:plasmid stabilization system protein ParE
VRRLTFHPEAEEELDRSTEFYLTESQKLGNDFAAEIARLLESIQQNPEAGQVLNGNLRRRLCSRFPFAIIYRFSETELYVVAVVELHRRPDYWRHRG